MVSTLILVQTSDRLNARFDKIRIGVGIDLGTKLLFGKPYALLCRKTLKLGSRLLCDTRYLARCLLSQFCRFDLGRFGDPFGFGVRLGLRFVKDQLAFIVERRELRLSRGE